MDRQRFDSDKDPKHWIEGPALIITDPNPGGATTANTVRFLLFFEPERRKKKKKCSKLWNF